MKRIREWSFSRLQLEMGDDAGREAYTSDWDLRDGYGVAGGDAAVAGAQGDRVGCGGVSADERSACGDGDRGDGALCRGQFGAAAGSGCSWECDLQREC